MVFRKSPCDNDQEDRAILFADDCAIEKDNDVLFFDTLTQRLVSLDLREIGAILIRFLW